MKSVNLVSAFGIDMETQAQLKALLMYSFPTNLMVGFVVDYVSGDIRVDEEELIHADFFAIDALDQVKTPPKGTIAYDLIEFVKQEYA